MLDSPPDTTAPSPDAPAAPLPPRQKRRPFDWAFVIVASISAAAAANVLWRDGWRTAADVFLGDSVLFLELLPKVAAGCLIGALFRVLVPPEMVRRFVGEGSGLLGLAIATAAGAVLPGGPFTIFPLAAILLVSGADRGAAAAFVTSWLLLGLNRAIIWELPFFGQHFVLTRVMFALPMPLLCGVGVRWADRAFATRLTRWIGED